MPQSVHQCVQQRNVDTFTCSLKWQQDGELSELDLHRIIDLLTQVDPVAEALISDHSEGCL
jgi:hypothetical protein